jgi:hypothetical protein
MKAALEGHKPLNSCVRRISSGALSRAARV